MPNEHKLPSIPNEHTFTLNSWIFIVLHNMFPLYICTVIFLLHAHYFFPVIFHCILYFSLWFFIVPWMFSVIFHRLVMVNIVFFSETWKMKNAVHWACTSTTAMLRANLCCTSTNEQCICTAHRHACVWHSDRRRPSTKASPPVSSVPWLLWVAATSFHIAA